MFSRLQPDSTKTNSRQTHEPPRSLAIRCVCVSMCVAMQFTSRPARLWIVCYIDKYKYFIYICYKMATQRNY